MQASPAVIFARFRGFHVQQLHRVFAVRSPLKRLRNRDRMCNRITAHARLYDYHLVRALPRHPRHRSRDTIEHQGAFPGKRMLMTGNSLIRDRRRATKLLRVSGINWPWGWFGSSSKRQKRAQNVSDSLNPPKHIKIARCKKVR